MEEACWIIKETPKKGLGMFAHKEIATGAAILTETPLVTFTNLGEEANMTQEFKVTVAQQFRSLEPGDGEKVLSLYCPQIHPKGEADQVIAILKANALEAWTGENEVDLFYTFSRINHSCRPNCIQQLRLIPMAGRRTRQVTMVAVRDILPGEEILWAYNNAPFAPRGERRDQLAFPCLCGDCGLEGEERRRNDRVRQAIGLQMENVTTALQMEDTSHSLLVQEILMAAGISLLDREVEQVEGEPKMLLFKAMEMSEELDGEEVGRRLRSINSND